MNSDLSQLAESELIDLNRRIVERLRMIRQVHARAKMMEFSTASVSGSRQICARSRACWCVVTKNQ